MVKICITCNKEKINFYKNSTYKSGYSNTCIDCTKNISKITYVKNIDRIKIKAKEYKIKNKDRYNELSRLWGAKNKEKRKIARKKWKDKNRSLVNHYEKSRQARLSGASGGHSYKDWLSKLDEYNSKCFYCGTTEKITKDHVIPVSKGGSDNIDNIVPACVSCNSKKKDKQ